MKKTLKLILLAIGLYGCIAPKVQGVSDTDNKSIILIIPKHDSLLACTYKQVADNIVFAGNIVEENKDRYTLMVGNSLILKPITVQPYGRCLTLETYTFGTKNKYYAKRPDGIGSAEFMKGVSFTQGISCADVKVL